MVSHFRLRAQAGPIPALRPGADRNALLQLLGALRGRPVAVLAQGRWIAGRVITLDPLVLLGADGLVTTLYPDVIQSVQF